MPHYDFRLGFRLPGQDYINADTEELCVLDDGGEVTIRLCSGVPGNPIMNYSHADLIGGPYNSAGDALNAAECTKRALLLWAVHNRIGIDLGGRHSWGAITRKVLQQPREDSRAPARAAVCGIEIFEHIDGSRLVLSDIYTASLGKGAQAFVEQVAAAIKTPLAMSAKQELAAEILSASYFDASDRTRFITLITAVEALLDPQPRPPAAQQLVERLVDIVRKSGLDKATGDALCGSLQWLKDESIGQAGRALAGRLLPGRLYLEQPPERFFSSCYGLRSSILHRGEIPQEVTDFPGVCSAAREFVCDLLIASFENVG